MKIKKIIYMFMLFAVLCGCFFYTPKKICAKEQSVQQTVEATMTARIVNNNNDVPQEIKEPIEKGKGLFTYIIRVLGWLVVVFGFVFLAISFFSHQTDQRIMGAIALFVGLLIAFSPEIANWITGSQT